MLKIQTNACRTAVNLNGIWKFKTVGEEFFPAEPLKNFILMPVPASMNDIVTDIDLREYVGKVAMKRNFLFRLKTAGNIGCESERRVINAKFF